MTLPTEPTSRAGMPPRLARILLAGAAKTGKTTCLGDWAPTTTLIVDTQNGTHLLDGEHYVQHVRDWPGFVRTVDDICRGNHRFHTIGLDLTNDLWAFCDLYYGRKDKETGLVFPASSQDDYGRSNAKARAGFKNTLGRLLAAPVGIWFLTHVQEKTDKTGELQVYRPDLDKSVYSYISGAADFIWLAEIEKGGRRVVHTQPTVHFEAGSRGPVPSPIPLDAAGIARTLDRVLNPQRYDAEGNRVAEPVAEPEAVPPTPVEPDPETAPPNVKDLGHDPEASDVTPEDTDLWVDLTQDRINALGLEPKVVRRALEQAQVDLPARVNSWPRVFAGLSAEQRQMLDWFLTEQETIGTPFEAEAPA